MSIRIERFEGGPDVEYVVRPADAAGGGYVVEATPEQVARWEAAAEEYVRAQREMYRLYDAAEEAEDERLMAAAPPRDPDAPKGKVRDLFPDTMVTDLRHHWAQGSGSDREQFKADFGRDGA